MLTTILLTSSAVGMFLIIWFRTEAYLEYCRLFKLDLISNYREYDEKRAADVSLTYLTYLRHHHNSFVIRLITCPICISAWLSAFISIVVFNLAILPITFIGGLILFGTIDRLLG